MSKHDNGVKVTREWLVAVGLECVSGCSSMYYATSACGVNVCMMDVSDQKPRWWCAIHDARDKSRIQVASPPQTRGDFRTICRFFGIKLKRQR